ncbi:MAG: peptidoglycan-associated lipoprotein Pal [Pseudomonadota bacterium]
MKTKPFFFTPSRGGLLSAVLLAALMAGCSSVPLEGAPVENRTPTDGSGANAGGTETGVANVNLGQSNLPAWGKLPRVVYFDLDSYTVKDEYLNVVEANAKALAADRTRRLTIEGHTDERGGREYNLALGQKRAESVAKSLTVLGASANQLEAVSFGKERPASSGTGESVWAQNRRAELNPR